MQKYKRPSLRNLNILRSYLAGPTAKDQLLGKDRLAWEDDKSYTDLFSLHEAEEMDPATQWLVMKCLAPCTRAFGHLLWRPTEHDPNLFHFADDELRRPVFVISTMLSSLLPVLAVTILYLVHSMPQRLGIMGGFTAAFSLAISLTTRASRAENFAGTAA